MLSTIAGVLVPLIGIVMAVTMGALLAPNAFFTPYNALTWHPIFMCMAFGCFMAQGVVAYSTPFEFLGMERRHRRWLHAFAQTLSMLCMAAGVGSILMYTYTGVKPVAVTTPPILVAHMVMGWITVALSTLTGLMGVVRMGLRAGGLDEKQYLPGARFHGMAGQAAWVCGMINIVLGAFKFQQGGVYDYGPPIGFLFLALLSIVLALALVNGYIPHGVAKDHDEHAGFDGTAGLLSDA